MSLKGARLELAVPIDSVLSRAAVTARRKDITVVIEGHGPVALCATVATLARLLTDVV